MTNPDFSGYKKSSFHEGIEDIRDKLADIMLVCIALIGAPLLIISFLRFIQLGGIITLSTNSAVYLSCVLAAFYRNKLTLYSKAWFVIGASLIIALTSVLKWGILASGVPYFIFCSILITIFFGIKPGIILTGINIAILLITGILYHTHILRFNFDPLILITTLQPWISAISVYGAFTTILIICLARIYDSMAVSIKNLENRTAELKTTKEQMEAEIKNRKDAENALKEKEEQFRAVLESLPVGMLVNDREGNNLIVNDEAGRITGYSNKELLSKKIFDLDLQQENMSHFKTTWQKLIETGEKVSFESVSRRKNGDSYNAEISLKSVIIQGLPLILAIVSDITDRKKAETALRESEERFKTVLENLPCGVSVHDLEGRHIFLNEEICKAKGYTKDELMNLSVMKTAGPSLEADNNVGQLWKGLKPGASITFEALSERKDKSHYESEIRLTKIMLEGREVILSLIFDITERKKIEMSHKHLMELDRLASEISSKIVGMPHYKTDDYIDEALAIVGKKTGVDHAYLFLFDQDTEIIDSVNEWRSDDTVEIIGPVRKIHGIKEMPWFVKKIRSEGIIHVPDIESLPPEAGNEYEFFTNIGIKSMISLVIGQSENLLGYLGFDIRKGKKEWSEDEIVILRIIGETFTNAIKRRNAEREQERLQAQLSTSVELAHLGPWEFDIGKNQFLFNDQFYKIYHTTAAEMGGYTMSLEAFTKRFMHPDDIDESGKRLNLRINDDHDTNVRGEHRMLYADGGTGYLLAQVSVIKNSDGIPVKIYGVNQDITEWKLAQQRLLENEEKLARAKKMESLGLLAGGVAHDLNNVLSGIVSYPELLLLDLPKDSKLRRPIETIRESGNKAVAIVQDLLTIARGAAITKKPLNLNRIINEYLESPEFINLKQHNTGVEIRTALDTNLFNINGSDIHIKKIVMNLVSNAAESIEKQGTVTITTSNRYVDMPIKRYQDVKTGEYAVLTVKDDGQGIPSENLDRIFEPFFTKKVMGRSGTGLGLAVVYNTMQDHSGYIDVNSGKNGSIFELYFPITRDTSTVGAPPVSLDLLKGNNEIILVVDDIETQREISCRMLEILGYNHVAVSSGEMAVEYFKNNSADLVLLDMIMSPGISGRETYEQIAEIRPGQKAVILSGYSESEDVLAIQKLGAGQYVKKPFDLETLGKSIKKELMR